ncbi:MAG TPA: trehalose-6-phosphate synthase [Actinomycetota bacterium]|nr:trehalose-6-phosphate synthase [Actinomycetota bacterium]
MQDRVTDGRVVFVSNRGPVSFTRAESGDGYTTKRGAGGLAGALDPVARGLGARAVWIAAATSVEDREALKVGLGPSLKDELGYDVRLLDIDPKLYERYYDEISNRMLWFANHCLWDEIGIEAFTDADVASWHEAYEPVNGTFAAATEEVSGERALILVQDYHLALLPLILRKRTGNSTILHFTHSSFCGPAGYERIPPPIPERFIRGMLGADLCGFHVSAWADGFMRAAESHGAICDRELGTLELDGRKTWIRTYPIPIDPAEIIDEAARPEARAWSERFKSESPGQLLVRADRCEPSKNIIRGFQAFSRLLERREDLRTTTRFIACVYPSRQSMGEYQRYAAEVIAAADRVNALFPGSVQLFSDDDFSRTLGALRVYDALIVNPIMDGMNLVSKEGACINERDGALILSTGAGSFDELGSHSIAIREPLDIDETSVAIEQALSMPAALRSERAASLRSIVTESTPREWIDAQLHDLAAIGRGEPPLTAAP